MKLAEGDTFIPGPWLVGGADPLLNAVPGIGTTALGRPNITILNAFGTTASALGNHEFDLGSPVLQSAILASGSWIGAQFPFITCNLDFSADSALRGLADRSIGGTSTNNFAGQAASAIKGKIAPYTIVNPRPTVRGRSMKILLPSMPTTSGKPPPRFKAQSMRWCCSGSTRSSRWTRSTISPAPKASPRSSPAEASHLLMLNQGSGKIIKVDRAGNAYSALTIVSNPGNPLSVVDYQHEGLTMDRAGNLYVVSEDGGGDFDHPRLGAYSASSAPKMALTAVVLTNQITAIVENISTAARVKVANLVVTDDGLGTNNLALSGADAAFFEVDTGALYIKAGTVLELEAKASYAAAVTVDDPGVGASPDESASLTLSITDVVNEDPARPMLFVSEVSPWSSGNSPVAADWFELTNTGANAVNIYGWKVTTTRIPLPLRWL